MPHKTDQEVNIKLEQIKALQNKLINHDNRSKFPFIKLLLQTSELIKMSARERHSARELHSTRVKLEISPLHPKGKLHLQKSNKSAEIIHKYEPLFFKTGIEKRTK